MSEKPTYPHDIEKAYVWWIERDNIAIAYLDLGFATYPANYNSSEFKYDSTTGRVYSPHGDHEGWEFRMHVVRNARELNGLEDEPEFPEQFHEALVDKVIQHGYEKTPETLKVAQYWEVKYSQKVREGLAYASKGRIGGFKKILGHF